jgi:hypothetical protein
VKAISSVWERHGGNGAANEPILRAVLGIPDAFIVQPIGDAYEKDWPVRNSIVTKSDVLVMMPIMFAAGRQRERFPSRSAGSSACFSEECPSSHTTLKERKEKHQRHM